MEFDKKLPLCGAQVGVVTMSCEGDAGTHRYSQLCFHPFTYPQVAGSYIQLLNVIYDLILLMNRQFRFLFYFCFFKSVLKHVSLGRSRQ